MARIRKVTKQVLDQMVAMRQSGSAYPEIEQKFGISKWACIKYLKGIEPIGQEDVEWKKAESEAVGVLEKEGFADIVNLNEIANAPHWDYYAKKDGERWLIDVTINSSKSVSGKKQNLIDNYRAAILYKISDTKWTLMELSLKKIFST